MKNAATFIFMLIALPLTAAEVPFDTLFFSPSQRAAMARAEPGGSHTAVGPSLNREKPLIAGLIKRSDGQVTVWLDGVAQTDRQNPAFQRLQPEDVDNPATTIRVKETSPQLVVVPVSVKGATANPRDIKKIRGLALLSASDDPKAKKKKHRRNNKGADDSLQNEALRLLIEPRLAGPQDRSAKTRLPR